MAFIKRLGWYLIGVSIGLIFLAIILKKKSGEEGIDFCYLPNCRVLKDIRSKKLGFSKEVNKQLINKQLDTTYFTTAFTKGDINFAKSNTKAKPCKIYFINYQNKEIELQNCKDRIIIAQITLKE